MDLGIMMLAEVGFFHVFFDFSTWMLSVAAWAFLLLGFAIQLLILKLCRTLWKRRLFAVLILMGLIAGELACQMITGLNYWLLWYCTDACLLWLSVRCWGMLCIIWVGKANGKKTGAIHSGSRLF